MKKMSKKQKIIFASVGAVLLIGLIVTLCLINTKPTVTDITIEYLFNKNRDYFSSLTSVSVTSDSNLDIVKKANDELSSIQQLKINKHAYVKVHYPTDTSYAEYSITQYLEDKNASVSQKMYKVKDGEDFQLYYADNISHTLDQWFTNYTDEKIEEYMSCKDFDIIQEREVAFNLEKDTVEIDGVKCYKATARFFNIDEIVDYYDIRNMIGAFGSQFMDLYIDVTVYFRADTEIIYKVEYNACDLLNRVARDLGIETVGDGTLYTIVDFGDFNAFDEIQVSQEFKDAVEEYHGDPIHDPIDIDNQYLETKGDVQFSFGQTLKDYSDKYEIVTLSADGNFNETIAAKNMFDFYLVSENNVIMARAVNISTEPVNYLDCQIVLMLFDRDKCASFDKLTFGSNITANSTFNDCKSALGRYTDSYDDGYNMVYQWLSYIDYCEIEISFNKETNKMQSYKIYSWDLKYFLENN